MLFSKYLFTTLAGLVGGVNAWAFTSSGGDIISRELGDKDGELRVDSDYRDKLISKEDERLSSEKQESETKFSQLNSENETTKEKSRTRRSAGDALQDSDWKLRIQQLQQNRNLENRRSALQSSLESTTSEFKQQLEASARSAFQTVQQAITQENAKLSAALSSLQESNKKLIQKVKDCIEQLPQSIFVKPSKLKEKNYCDYVAEEKSKKA